MHTVLALAASAALLIATSAHGADLTVTIEGVADARGQVMVGVFDSAATFPYKVMVGKAVPAAVRDAGGTLTVSFAGLAEGVYAVSAIHDRDGDTQLGTNLLGIPSEPYGFNGDAVARFGPPAFTDIAFKLGASGATVKVRLR